MSPVSFVLFLVLLSIAVLVALLIPVYRRDRQAFIQSYRQSGQVIETSFGPLEYATTGAGYPVIMLHGMGGGCEQGLLMGQLPDPARYQIIAPSRPGHRRTPLATGPTFEGQADAVATLLDILKVDQATVVGLSGGGFAAIQFALRHPDRCRALVLLSAHGPGTYRFMPPRRLLWILDAMLAVEFIQWIAVRLPPQIIMGLEGSRPRRLRDPQVQAQGATFLRGFFPASDWKAGTFHDISLLFDLADQPDWPLDQIQSPTLVLHGERDLVVRPASAQYHAQQIPGAQITTFPDGTHMSIVTHARELGAAMEEFLSHA